ncbi:hypothetical protein C8R47DRAFT_1106211 [Mycena vitilis]|nr:hypothetical protein C8R47DRAFT_1106211 [Mycena vitilis]
MQQPPWPQYSYYSSHYAQAYMQQALPVAATPQCYTTYDPSVPQNSPIPGPSSAPWYQSGGSRCTYKNCTFRGSAQTVETHMMDRHLIFPPGWEKRKKRPDWDADPSLKGKPIPIQGTTILLDSPEEVDAWVAERKRRWPSAPRVEEKKRKMEEAVARGQLSLEDSGLAGRKRRRMDDGTADRGRGRGRHVDGGNADRGRGRGTPRARGRGRGVDAGWGGRGRGGMPVQQRPPPAQADSSSSDDSDDDDDAPETVSSKPEHVPAPPPQLPQPEVIKRPRPPQPKPAVRNNFASRPTLLRNVSLLRPSFFKSF